RLRPERPPPGPVLLQQPGLAGVDEEGLAVVGERQLLDEVERLDRGVVTLPEALPPPEQEAQRRQVRVLWRQFVVDLLMRHGVLRGSPCPPCRPPPRRPGHRRRS